MTNEEKVALVQYRITKAKDTYSNLFDKRQTGDYEDFLDHTREDVDAPVQPAQQLILEVEALINK